MRTPFQLQRRRIAAAAAVTLSGALFLPSGKARASMRRVTDAQGRTVEVPSKPTRLVCTGSGALRIASYLGALDCLVGIESSDLRYAKDPKRDYAFANHDRFEGLPVIGKGGGTGYTANPEAILAVEPDVILSGYAPEAAEQLARETGLPVVSVSYQSLGLAHPSFLAAVELAGGILGKEARAREITDFVKGIQSDLKTRASRRKDAGPTVYPGAVTFNGSHGFAGTYSHFGPLAAVGARSISDRADREGFYEADLEFVLQRDPDVIFLDPGNLSIVEEEAKARADFFRALKAVQNGHVFAMPSFNQYSTNIAYSLSNAYYAGTVLFPEAFSDIDFPTRFDEIVSFFNGRGWFAQMAPLGQPYGKIAFPGL